MLDSLTVPIDIRPLFADSAADEKAALRRKIVETCNRGRIVLLEGADLGVDLHAFEMAEPFPSTLCKMGMMCNPVSTGFAFHDELPFRLDYPGSSKLAIPYISQDDLTAICTRSFDGNWDRFERFLLDCRTVHHGLQSVMAEILHEHLYYADCPVLRFSQPDRGKLHFDPNPSIEGKESLRIFANLDTQPRHWTYSTTLLDAVDRNYHAMKLNRFFEMDQPDRMAQLLKRLSAHEAFRGSPRVPVAFQPGQVWIFDGRVISHELVAGRRAVSLTTKIRQLPDYHVSLKDRLFALHERKQSERQTLSAQRLVA